MSVLPTEEATLGCDLTSSQLSSSLRVVLHVPLPGSKVMVTSGTPMFSPIIFMTLPSSPSMSLTRAQATAKPSEGIL